MTVAESLKLLADELPASDAIFAINEDLEQTGSPLLLTEKAVERCWSRATQLQGDGTIRWLLLIRLAEAALLCAGNYADNCEFRAAGDFLVNPREIIIRSRCGGHATIKQRHGRLSEQFGFTWSDQSTSTQRFPAGVVLEITQPPLLPLMTRFLKESGCVATAFIQRLEGRQRRIADALSFLAGWKITDSIDLWRRTLASSASERVFVESCLCRFNTKVFCRLGDDLRRSLAQPDYRSSFLSESHEWENRSTSRPSATLLKFAETPA
jgi:hypothetical protein